MVEYGKYLPCLPFLLLLINIYKKFQKVLACFGSIGL
uniref:Uncharacterized protein n=1 Tax=Klebsiella phage Hope TaxID=3350564 RepID=A0AB74UQE4_9CAUD